MRPDLRFIIPNMYSIDGESPPRNYLQSVVPWMLQSPIYPTIGLLISSAIQSMISGGGVTPSYETAAFRARAYSLMHEYIRSTSMNEWAKELMGCVLNLIAFEVRLLT